ncbi:MAG: hypothetical protein ABIQ02_00060 [Saprospiraceae bacterium]
MGLIKHLIKKYFQVLWMKDRFSAATQISQRHLFHFYQVHYQDTEKINLNTTGYSVFSQFEEDGKILYLLAVIGIKNSSFIEIGSDDGLNSNCANLALNFGWHGLFIDANERSLARGRYFYSKYPNTYGYKPKFIYSKVNRENINSTIEQGGYSGEIDLLSLDIDGNDYWVWDAISIVNPRIVIIETHIIYGKRNMVAPYDPDYFFPGKHAQYHGASPVAMVKLGEKKGYRLVGANDLGFNFIFLRNDLGEGILKTASIDDVLSHPSCKSDQITLDPYVLTLPFVTPIE